MASIGPINPSAAPSASTAVGSVAAPQPSGLAGSAATLAALSQAFASGNVYGGPLGLGRPNTPEDAGAILAAAELALEETASDGRKERIQNTYGGGRAAMQGFAGAIGGVQLGVALDKAAMAADARTQARLGATQALQSLNVTLLGQGQTAVTAAAAVLAAAAPAARQSIDATTYAGLLSTAQASLQAAAQTITDAVAGAKQQALADGTASLKQQLASVDASLAEAETSGLGPAVAALKTTREALAGDLAGLSAALDAAYGGVLTDSTAALATGEAALADAIATAAGTKPAKRYVAADVAAIAGTVRAAADGVPSRIGSIGQDKAATAAAVASTIADQGRLTADIAAQFGSLQQKALAILPVFSRIATDVFGVGDHRTDTVRSAELTRGFEGLEDAARAFREAEAARGAQDGRQRSQQDQDRDGKRVSDLAAGLLAGLGDLKAILQREAAASSSGTLQDPATGHDNRLRLSL